MIVVSLVLTVLLNLLGRWLNGGAVKRAQRANGAPSAQGTTTPADLPAGVGGFPRPAGKLPPF